MKYEQARQDFEYLQAIAELNDQVELDSRREELMQNPTKKLASEMYEVAIGLWFGEHAIPEDDDRVIEIVQRYGYEWKLSP